MITDPSSIEYTISLREVTKTFSRHKKFNGYSTIKSALLSCFRESEEKELPQTVALKALTMRVPKGSSIGVIGKNGSGKSTLLKLITGIYQPDSGVVQCSGRVSALIELGAGFHPDFTGRENVFLGGMIQGLSKKEIRARFDDIVEFAELEDFIDEPVRTYSSGMFMRLGFSVAIHADPEVLLIDEVLAVGDEGFVSKCKGKISALRERGVTLMLVTHDLPAVERWCDEVLWLDGGVVMERGEPRRVIDAYRQFIEGQEEESLEEQNLSLTKSEEGSEPHLQDELEREPKNEFERWGSREIEITGVRLENSAGKEHFVFHPQESAVIAVDYVVRDDLQENEDVVFGVAIHHADGTLIFGTNTDIEKSPLSINSNSGTIACRIPNLSLLAGDYWIDIAVHRDDGYPYDYWKRCVKFSVRSAEQQVGKIFLETEWEERRSLSSKSAVA